MRRSSKLYQLLCFCNILKHNSTPLRATLVRYVAKWHNKRVRSKATIVHQSINHDRKMQRDIKFELTCHWSKCFCCVPTRLLEVASSIKMSCFKRGTEAVLRRAQSHNITAVSNIASQLLVAHPASQRAVAHPLKNEWPFKMDGRLPFLSRSEMHTANRDHKEVTRRSFRHHN